METLTTYARPFFEWLLRSTVQASIVVCLILLIQAALRNRLTARWHYALWLILVVRMVLPWAPQSRFSIYNLAAWERKSNVPAHVTPEQDAEPTKTPGELSTAPQTTAAPESAGTTEGQDASSTAPIETPRARADSATHLQSMVTGVLPLFWLAGALLLGGYIILCNLRLWRAASIECPSTDTETLDLLEECRATIGLRIIVALVPSEKVSTPILLGFVRPRLLVPKDITRKLSREELRYIFLHELAHVKRHDIALGWLTALLQVVHWFNPLVWLAFHRMRSNRESACDALVLSRVQGERAENYGLAIVSLLEHFSVPQPLPGLAGILESKSQLKRRMTMITQFKKKSYQWSPLAVALIVLLAGISLPNAVGSRKPISFWSKSEPGISLRRIKTGPMSDFSSPPSPDGRYLCDLGAPDAEGYRPLAVRDLVTGEVRPLTEASRSFPWCPVISPDSKHVAYVCQSWSPPKNELQLIGMDGTEHRVLYRLKEDEKFHMRAWTPDGKKVLGAFKKGSESLQLVTFSIEDGSLQVIYTFDTYWPMWQSALHKVAISPDGRYIAYDRPAEKGSWNAEIYILDIEHKKAECVVQHPAYDKLLGWTPDGNHIFFTSDRRQGLPGGFTATNTRDAYLLPVAGGKTQGPPVLIKSDIPDTLRPKGFTSSGSYHYTVEFKTIEAVVAKLDLQAGKLLTKPQAVGQTGAGQIPAWSPDGRLLAYGVHKPDQSQTIRIQDTETGGERELHPNLPHFSWLRWSPDGKSFLVSNFAGNSPRAIYRINADTGERLTMVQSESSDTLPGQPQLSADGSILYYVLFHSDSDKASLLMRDIESGHEEELFALEGTRDIRGLNFALSPDGRQLALATEKMMTSAAGMDKRIFIMPAKGGEPRELWKTEGRPTRPPIAWTADGQALLFTKRIPEGGRELWLIPAGGGQARKLCSSQEMMCPGMMYGSVHSAMDMHPDGQRIAFDCFEYRHEVWAMENFLPNARRTSASETLDTKPPMMVVRQVWADAADPQFMGAPSPDGRYLSYVDWDTGDLAVRDLTTGKIRRLTDEGRTKGLVSNSVFSPDSRQIVYYWWDYEKKSSQLRILGLDGSGPRVVNQDKETSIYARGIYPTGWTPDGKHILALGRRWDRTLEILLVPVTGEPVGVLKTLGIKLPGGRRIPGLCLSPDGRYVAYTFLPSEESMNRDISVVATDGSHEIPLVKYPADDFVLGWSPDGKRVVFASDRTGSMGIWAIEVAEGKMQGTPQLLKPEVGQFYPLGLAQNGSFYYGVYSGSCNVYTAAYDPQKGDLAAKPIVAVHRYEGSNWAPDWSPDGRHLACVSVRPGASPVFLVSSIEKGGVRELSPNLKDFNVHSLRWSPDGRSLLGVGTTTDASWGVLKVDAETGEVTVIVEGAGIFGPNWAADGKTVFYVCNLKTSGRILRHNLATGEKKELYSAPGFISALALCPDGRQLAFHDIQGGALKVLSATGAGPRELAKVEGQITIAWTPDGRQLVYGSRGLGEGPGHLRRISAGGGEPQKLDIEMPYLDHVRFRPDGRQIAFTGKVGKDKCEVWVMENFLPESTAGK